MKQQLKKAGIESGEERLSKIALDAVTKHPNDRAAAAAYIERAVFADLALLWHYTKWAHRESARRLLEQAYKQVRGGNASGAGQKHPDTHASGARATNPDAVAIPSPPKGQLPAAAASGPIISDAMKRVVRLSILDTFRITDRQGSRIPIGDISISAVHSHAERMGRNSWINARERELMLMISAAAGGMAYRPETKVREIFSGEQIKRFIEQAGGIAKHPDLSGFYETMIEDGDRSHA